ncbi:hypothetical protein [Agrobacterium sp.]|jgi:hypothetical protein|uniref:hypothetical protein n=1 Tax=Agrobacterium sp. TaxID=361 RepID=UPI0028B13537|nr:hypothetical protein [Agrobacterium sp.]
MPLLSEVRYYLHGLWLMFCGDPKGQSYLDLSDRGMLRSFFSAIWSLPALILSWMWWQRAFTVAQGPESATGFSYYLRLALVEAICWVVPLVLIGCLMLLSGVREKFPAVVTVVNWLNLPYSYASTILVLIAVALPGLQGFIALLWFSLLLSLVWSLSRILALVLGKQPLLISTAVMTLLIPGMLLSELLQRFLGVYPG